MLLLNRTRMNKQTKKIKILSNVQTMRSVDQVKFIISFSVLYT